MTKAIEKALFISSPSQLGLFRDSFQRIYFGQEFCERLLPSKKDLLKVKSFCSKKGISLSLVTPILTDAGLENALALSRLLLPEDEIIVNDYGLLHALQNPRPVLVAGRLLNRQFRDPRIASFRGKVSDSFFMHLQQSHAASPEFQSFLLENSFARAELDNLLQGIGTDLSKSQLHASLYFPFVFVSLTRMCLSANCNSVSFQGKVGVFPCSRECQSFQFNLKSSFFPNELLLFGNAVLFKNSALPKEPELLSMGIDRLVTNKALQLPG
ncbi:MAG: hypothetical protein JW744_02780 [Candidatus Diapherotrites archaeon]|uniref:Uncharacterized protein n=1 Tax=Candidatus Iainarchaeum sp. TaxID=3101447 RepID=A0A939C6E8_9ARCH|nr:hypothetical protein [Candidatus Diapherotrites archaeon]